MATKKKSPKKKSPKKNDDVKVQMHQRDLPEMRPEAISQAVFISLHSTSMPHHEVSYTGYARCCGNLETQT
jgi:hypothetical protein